MAKKGRKKGRRCPPCGAKQCHQVLKRHAGREAAFVRRAEASRAKFDARERRCQGLAADHPAKTRAKFLAKCLGTGGLGGARRKSGKARKCKPCSVQRCQSLALRTMKRAFR
jgi:hypothetical protein